MKLFVNHIVITTLLTKHFMNSRTITCLHNKSSCNLFVHGVKIMSRSNVQMSICEVFMKVCKHFTRLSKLFLQSSIFLICFGGS